MHSADASFRRESDMRAPLNCWLWRQDLLAKFEFDLPWGVCDVVGLSFDRRGVRRRLSLCQRRPIGPPQRIQLLNQIPDEYSGLTVSFDRLKKWADESFSLCNFDDHLQHLIADHFVIVKSSGDLQRRRPQARLHRRIVAIELKLSRITEALSQAVSNTTFATESYIAMPGPIAERLARTSECERFREKGVGIISVRRSVCRVALPSHQVGSHDEILQTHCVERFWRTRDNSTSIVEPHAPVFEKSLLPWAKDQASCPRRKRMTSPGRVRVLALPAGD
jgi:hypothetical protein